jgi:hypothetical protein
VVERDGQPVVFEVRDGRARQRAIVTGLERSAGIVVKAGLNGAEMLVARPPETLRDGDTVKIQG